MKIKVNISVEGDLIDKVDRWAESQPAAPSRSAVIEAALEDFLDHHRAEVVLERDEGGE